MKKKISLLLAIAVLFTAISALLAPLETQAASASVLYENSFESNMDGWTALGTSNADLSRTTEASYGSGSHSLKLAHHYDTWYSPQLNLYPLMKAMGPGTYAFTIDVMADGTYTKDDFDAVYLMIRGNSQEDENSFIQEDSSHNYLKRISNCVYIESSQWCTFTGSVKVLASDLTRDTGNFMFCVDGIPSGNINVYIDNVRIWRLSDEGITNGTFSDGMIGWRSWTEYATPTPLTIDSSLFAKYIRIAEYGSIACNVDQILSYYGPGRYTLSFSMRVDNASESETPFIFYLTSNFTQYHQWIHQQVITPNSGWKTISITLTIDTTIFALLNPDEKEVHFRIQCPEQERPPYHTEYSIDNVSLTPVPVTALGNLPEGEQPMAVGQQLQLPSPGIIPNYTPGRLDWYSSNPSIATVDASGLVSGHAPGVVTITARARSGGATASCTVAVKQVIGGFVGYGQERPHYCWLACAKSHAHTYALQHSDVTFNNTSLQAAYDATKLPELDGSYTETGDRYDLRRAINYFLSRTNYEYDCLEMVCINSTDNLPPLTQNQVTNLIDQGKPIIVSRWNVSNPQAWTEGHSFIIYGYTYKNSVLFLELYDPLRNNRLGGIYAASFSQIVSQGSIAWMEALYLK